MAKLNWQLLTRELGFLFCLCFKCHKNIDFSSWGMFCLPFLKSGRIRIELSCLETTRWTFEKPEVFVLTLFLSYMTYILRPTSYHLPGSDQDILGGCWGTRRSNCPCTVGRKWDLREEPPVTSCNHLRRHWSYSFLCFVLLSGLQPHGLCKGSDIRGGYAWWNYHSVYPIRAGKSGNKMD